MHAMLYTFEEVFCMNQMVNSGLFQLTDCLTMCSIESSRTNTHTHESELHFDYYVLV